MSSTATYHPKKGTLRLYKSKRTYHKLKLLLTLSYCRMPRNDIGGWGKNERRELRIGKRRNRLNEGARNSVLI